MIATLTGMERSWRDLITATPKETSRMLKVTSIVGIVQESFGVRFQKCNTRDMLHS